MTHIIRQIFLLSIIVSLFGCSESKQTTPELISVNFDQWQQEIKKYKTKILVVDAWATWCESCLERFPHMVDLSEKYADQAVQFVSLNLDDRDSPEDLDLAKAFLSSVNANFPHYTLDENMMEGFEKLDFLSIPVVLVYDAKGAKRYQMSGDNPNNQFTDDDVETAIATLLAETG